MIERQFISQKIKEFQIQEFISSNLQNIGHSHTKVVRTPLGEKIVIYASRPGLIVGRKGQNIKKLTLDLKKLFELENPQIEISEVEDVFLDATIVAEIITSSLERFGSSRFKGVGHRILQQVMGAGALGVEVVISGKLPGSRAKSWRFYQGYLKKCGEVSQSGVRMGQASAKLKSGTVGVQVKIMPGSVSLPDNISRIEEDESPTTKTKPAEETKDEPKAKKDIKTSKKGKGKKAGKKKSKAGTDHDKKQGEDK